MSITARNSRTEVNDGELQAA